MDEPTRRAWSKPELIVLVRGKPEEAVLGACKTTGTGTASHSDDFGCAEWNLGCSACDSWGTS